MDIGRRDSVGAGSSRDLQRTSSAMSSRGEPLPARSSGSQLTAGSQGFDSNGDDDAGAGGEEGKNSSSSGEEPPSGALANPSQQAVELMSPGFRSAAALAGWDDEALILAALNQSPTVGSLTVGDNEPAYDVRESPACRDRKRDKRTPLSSARRHRRVRWIGNNGNPLVRVPMKALPLLSDNEKAHNNVEEGKCNCASSAKGDKENVVPGAASARKKTPDTKGKLKEKTPTKLPYMDQLREELSCAVCLDICFEPSTISCGHSFCGTCLQSVLKMCGPKCPKCRQSLRSENLRSCRTNTVLWNTIQILFPKECAARQEDNQKQHDQEEAANFAKNTSGSLGVRTSRLQPWRSSSTAFSSTVNRISVMGTLRSSFQTAAQFLGDDRDAGARGRGEVEVGQVSSSNDLATHQEPGPQRSQSRSGRIRRIRQEQVDAALAARLQQAELMMGPNVEESPPEESRQPPTYIRSWNHNRPRYGGTVALAAANLRTAASRGARHRSRP